MSSSLQFLEPSVDGLSSPASSSTLSKSHYFKSDEVSLDVGRSKETVTVTTWFHPLREIFQGEEIAWYADGDSIVRNEHNPSIAYAYGFHVDDSELTLNVCLGKQFSGGELFFHGVRCEKHVNTEIQPEVASSVKWLEDELELNALHNPGSRRGSGNERAAVN